MAGASRGSWPDPRHPESPRVTGPGQSPAGLGGARMGIEDLTWSDIADALWLTSVAQDALREPRAPEHPVRPPVEAEAAGELGCELPAAVDPGDSGDAAEATEGTGRPHEKPHQPRTAVRAGLARLAGPYLAGSLEMVRALRPLKRKVSSPAGDEVVLDEESTAERAAEHGLWFPVTRPNRSPWLDLTVVVDAGPSMALWRSTVGTFVSLLERLGAFRSVQLRRLDTDGSSDGRPLLRGATADTPARGPGALLDRSGRRILMVLTDGVGRSWRHGVLSSWLALWASSMPVAVVQLLPQRLWGRGGLAPHRARLTVPGALTPNRRWGLELPDAWLAGDPAQASPAGAVPVPILELEPRWLRWWARLVTGRGPEPARATVLLAGEGSAEPVSHGANGGEASAEERVRSFLSVASPSAYRLATLLAAVPVSVPVARLVQAELVPESGAEHLAEVFTSGLLRIPETATGRPWDTIPFVFGDSVRGVLLSGARRSDTAHVVRMVAEHFDDQGTLQRFREALDAPDSTPDPEPTPDTAHHIRIEAEVMRALSGPYLSRAARLGADEDRISSASASSAPESEADTMAAVTEPTRPSTSILDSPANAGKLVPESVEVDTSGIKPPDPLTEFAPAIQEQRRDGDVPPIWGNVPPRNPNFTGRQEALQWLGERLTAGGATAVLPAALHGMGGIGKTQMAVEYIYRHLRDYDIVWWIQATQQAQIRAALTELARRLGLPGSSEAHSAVPAVREALRVGRPFRRWLLVFDSAESPDAVRAFFPTNGPGEILVTSRNPAWAGIARPLEVSVFRREESKELLKRRGPEIDDTDADRLAEKLGDLPLAIEQAAAWRAETGMPVEEYLRLFDEKAAEILDTASPADYEVSVAAAWNVSFDELRTRNPAAHQLLQVCAFFAPEPIPRNIFTGVRGISISPDLDAALRDPMQLSRTIRDIHRYGLAKIDYRHDTLQLHRLVQFVLSSRMTAQRAEKMRHGAHLLLANFDPNDPVSSENWPRYHDVLTHAYSCGVITCNDRWVRNLVVNLMNFLYWWGDHEEAAKLAQDAVDTWSEQLGEADAQTLEAARNLGFYLWTVGRYGDAARRNQHTLELQREISGEDSEETVLAELAVVGDLRGKGDFVTAVELSEQIHTKAKGLFGEDDPTTLVTAHNLVVALGLAGKYQRGQELAQDTYQRRAEVLGYDNRRTASTLTALILARREAGDYVWARAEQEKLAERGVQMFGRDRAAILPRLHHLAVARRKSGDHPAALALSAQVMERYRVRYGDAHPGSLAAALAQSIDLRHAGDTTGARRLGEHTFEQYRRVLGEQHPHTLSALLDLAVTLRTLGDPSAARELDERVLERFRTALGPDHPHAIVAGINLASDLAAQGESEEALNIGTEVLDRAKRVLGYDHPTTIAALRNLVLDLRAVDRGDEAETRYAEVMTRYRRVLGDTHPATVAASGASRADCDIDPLPL